MFGNQADDRENQGNTAQHDPHDADEGDERQQHGNNAHDQSGDPESVAVLARRLSGRRMLENLVATSTETAGITDIYAAAGIPRPSLSELDADFTAKAQAASNPHLAIEALRDVLTDESGKVTRNNLVRQRAFSQRLRELMNKYTNQQLTSAEVIAELIDMAKEIAAESRRGEQFDPPLDHDHRAFFDAVSANESAVELMGDETLAQIVRDLVATMRRDVKTDWTVRDDVPAKLRSSVKRLLVKYKYPPDQQPEAIKLVIEQMEDMAPRFAEESKAA